MLSIKTIVGVVSILTPQIASTQFVSLASALRWNQIANGTSSTINQQTHREALDASTLRNYWTQVLRQSGEPPKVDFFRDKVVIVFLGQRNTGGFGAQIKEIRHEAIGQARVIVQETTPAAGAITTQALTQPWVMFQIDRSYTGFRFSFEKAQQVQNPWIPGGPGGFPPLIPCNPCFGGWGAPWNTPQVFVFNNWNGFTIWSGQNQIGWNGVQPNINWGQQQLAFVSPGQFGAGFNLNILGLRMQGNVGIVQMERSSRVTAIGQNGIPWATIACNSSIQQLQVELIDRGSNAQIHFGEVSGRVNEVTSVVNSQEQLRQVLGTQFDQLPATVRSFDFKNQNLAIVINPRIAGSRLGQVVYQQNRAELQLTRNQRGQNLQGTGGVLIAKVDKNIRQIGVTFR